MANNRKKLASLEGINYKAVNSKTTNLRFFHMASNR